MGEVVPFKRPAALSEPVVGDRIIEHRTGIATCGVCGHRWVAVFPSTVEDVSLLACPASDCAPAASFVERLDMCVHDDAGLKLV